MVRRQSPQFAGFIIVAICISLGLGVPASAQDAAPPSAQAKTTADPTIPVAQLNVVLRPLTKDELEVELRGWLELLRAKITEVGEIELELLALPKEQSGEELSAQLVSRRTEETAIAERARAVLDALKAKGGDVETAEQFILAVSDISETTDVTTYRTVLLAEFTSWIRRDDGGKLWAKRVALAAVILLIFWVISKFAGRVTARALARHPRASSLLENFARRTAGGVVFVVGGLMSLSVLGVEVGPMMAALGAGGFIVGFALQETLASFASGMMIMVYRPFDVDDYVAVSGVQGTVKEMSLVSTTLLTIDNKVVVIPNKKAWGDTIINYTGKDIRRIDLVFRIGYGDDLQQAINLLKDIASEHDLILKDPPVVVRVDSLADSCVNLICRPWCKTGDYWTVRWDLTSLVKERFDEAGISIPYPQRDVHVLTDSGVPELTKPSSQGNEP